MNGVTEFGAIDSTAAKFRPMVELESRKGGRRHRRRRVNCDQARSVCVYSVTFHSRWLAHSIIGPNEIRHAPRTPSFPTTTRYALCQPGLRNSDVTHLLTPWHDGNGRHTRWARL